jgi:hypothetical protein
VSSFSALGPALFDKLSRITTVIAVLQDWDEPRAQFLREVKALGTAVSVIVVHEGPTTRSWQDVEIGQISQMTPDDVDRRIASSAPSPRAQEARRA